MRLRWIVLAAITIVVLLFFVPVIPWTKPQCHPEAFCLLDLGIDYASATYALFHIGVYYTVWGTFVLSLYLRVMSMTQSPIVHDTSKYLINSCPHASKICCLIDPTK